MFIHGSNSTGNTVRSYDPLAETEIATLGGNNANFAFAAINNDGTRIAYRTFNGGISILDKNLATVDTVADLKGGAVYGARGEFFYAVDSVNDQLVAFDTVNYDEQFRLEAGDDLEDYRSLSNRATMTAAGNARQVYITTATGVRMFSLAHAVPHTVTIVTGNETFDDRDFGCQHPTFDAAALGEISGKKWNDDGLATVTVACPTMGSNLRE